MADLPDYLREFDDTAKTRQLIYDGCLEAVKNRFPVEDDNYRLELTDVHYDGPMDYSLEQQKQALLKSKNLRTPIKGKWRLIHKPSNTVLDEREDTVLQVPYYTNRGTVINNGNDYSIISQMRLRPGVYARRKRTGELETHFNIKPGTGRGFRFDMDPSTGVFSLTVGQSHVPLYPLLKGIGVTDQELTKSWGADIVAANAKRTDAQALQKTYRRMAGAKADINASPIAMGDYIKDAISKYEVDPEIVARTMGIETDHLTPELLVRGAQKLLDINRGDAKPDNRDNPRYTKVYAIEDLMKERIEKDAGRLSKNLLFRIKRDGSLRRLPKNALNPYLDSFIIGSGLTMPGEEANPLSNLEQMTRMTRFGEGGIRSEAAVTAEARDVNGDWLGFVDPIQGPEGCNEPDTEVFTEKGWMRWDQVTEDTKFACLINGQLCFHKPEALHVYDYDGLLYCAKSQLVSYRVTKNHRLWTRTRAGSYQFSYACDQKGRRNLLVGGHEPYEGSHITTITLPKPGNAKNCKIVKSIDVNDFAALLGWFISEGHVDRYKNRYRTCISQDKGEKADEIEALLDRLPFKYTKIAKDDVAYRFEINNKQLTCYLEKLGKSYEKHIPEEAFEYPPDARHALLAAMCHGDGRKQRSGLYEYCTVSHQLALDFERLAFSLGYSSRIGKEYAKNARDQLLWIVRLHTNKERQVTEKDRFTKPYKGKVYCATVPGGLMYCRYDEYGAHWTGNSKIGVDVRASYRTFKGKDNKLYGEFTNARNGKTEYVDIGTAADRVVAFPGQDMNQPYVYAMKDDVPTKVPTTTVDYIVPSFAHMMGSNTNMNPMPTAVQGGRQFYGSKFWAQYLPQVKGQVPLVDNLMPDGKTTFSEYYGRRIGTLSSPVDGTVVAVNDNSIVVKDALGKKHTTELVNNLPFNRLSVSGDTEVFVKTNGRIRKIFIRDYVYAPGDEVLSYDPETMMSSWKEISGFIAHSCDKKMYRVSYQSGRYVDVTEDHSLLTLGDNLDIVPIYPKDCIVGKTKSPVVFGSVFIGTDSTWTRDRGYIDGLYLSEGSIGKSQKGLCQIAVDPDDRNAWVRNLVTRLGFKPHKWHKTATGNSVSFTSHELYSSWQNDFGKYSNKKHIAGHVYSRSREYLEGLIAGYFGGDGCLWSDTNGACQLEVGSTSQQLILDIQAILTLFGIFTTIKYNKFNGIRKNGDECFRVTKLRVSTSDIHKLREWLCYPDRQKKLDGLVRQKYRATEYDCLPVINTRVRKYINSCFDHVPHYVSKSTSHGFISKYRLIGCHGIAGIHGNSDIKWDRIVSVDEIDTELIVYDFSVYSSEAFALSSGLLVHNSAISYMPAVQVGQDVKAGDMIANSNYTDAKTGAINMGQNLKVAIIPHSSGLQHEDAHLISESAAKRLATDRLYSDEVETRNGVIANKNKYIAAFPQKFTKQQFETLDDDGIVKVGTEVHQGDPLIVAIGPKVLSSTDAQLGKLSKTLRNAFVDKAEVWEHDWPGVVVDTAMTSRGARVNIKSTPPVTTGDKLSGRYGLKGVTAKVVPDDKMPRDAATNEPYDMLVNPMGFLSRVAPGQLMEIALGKIAHHTGKQIRLPQLPPPEGWAIWTKNQLDAAGLKDSTDIFDPETGKTIPNVGDGYMFVSAFHHLAEKKASSRGAESSYTQDEQPAKGGYEGAKRISGLDLYSLLAHGATDVIKDYVTIRGTRNEQYWNALRLGLPIPEPGVPFIYDKFLNTLKAGGINVVEKGNITKILPLTDKDIDKLAGTRLITSSAMVDGDLDPVKGGLFDPGKTGGMAGNFWSAIPLPEPVPNPIMEEPIRRVLGLTVKQMEDVLSGAEQLDGKTGGQALKDALSKVDIDKKIAECRHDIKTRRGSQRDNAIKVLGYLTSMKEQELAPQDWMINKVPVIPPKFRPASKLGDVVMVADLNDLYKEVIENANLFKDMHKDLPDSATTEERLNLYRSVKAAYGLGESITPEGQAKGLKGAIRQVIGTSPKFGMFQRKVISKTVDTVSRSVVTPDPNLDMDQLGIPEDSAWQMYRPFVMRALVRRGYPPTTAIRMLDDRDKTAREMLEKEMEQRPVLMDRAPTWHKFNIMAFKPHIVDGDTVRVCPLVESGFNMDYDGDENIGNVVFYAKSENLESATHGIKKTSLQSLKFLVNYLYQE